MRHLRVVSCFVLAAVVCLLSSPRPARADTCGTASLSDLMGTTCTIGSLEFSFTSVSSDNYSYNNSTSKYAYDSPWTASDFTFTPVTDGFSLTFTGTGNGAGSVTATSNVDAFSYFELTYTVTDLNGLITGESGTTNGTLSATGSSLAYVYNPEYSTCGYGLCNNEVYGENYVGSSGGSSDFSNVLGSPFSWGYGYATPFSAEALNSGTASWTGTVTTFTYDSVSTPEPGTLELTFIGLLGIGLLVRRRLVLA